MDNPTLIFFISPSNRFTFFFENPFSAWLLIQLTCSHRKELLNHPIREKLRMGNGEMVSMNSKIYFNPHGEIGKTPLLNCDMVKAQLDISFSTT